jgi:dTDP-4-dehydrorhamnose 3,5-epimerase
MIKNITKTSLDGVLIVNNIVHNDSRGSFMENYREDEFNLMVYNCSNFVQDNVSLSHNRNVIRGLHYQLKYPQDKLVSVLNGAILDVVVDIRKDSPTFGKYISVILTAFDGKSIFIPKGYAHGFRTLYDGNNVVSYKTTEKYHSDDAYTIYWNDPNININWQFTYNEENNVRMSDSDKNAKCLNQIDTAYLPVVDMIA